ncbi:MAG: acyltransferase family protein [Actinomycetota bacterium]
MCLPIARCERRRSRRILPAYYAALALSIASIVGARIVFGEAGNDAALSPGSVISHLLLVHTFTADWAFRINGPMWSVATEWHIYFLLPLVLLPLWRRFGAAATVTLAWAAPLALHLLVSDEWNFWWAAPWFVGSFAIGMLGAVLSHTGGPELRLPWGTIGLASLALLVALLAIPETSVPLIYLDFVVSVMSMGLIMLCVRQVITAASATSLLDIEREPQRASWLTGFLGSAPLLSLGAFSYSLYLLQHPLLRFTEAILDRTSLGFEAVLWVQLIIGVPIIMVVSRIFAEFFEMPFTSGSPIVDRLGQRFPLPTARGRAMSLSGASGGTPPDQPPSGSAT